MSSPYDHVYESIMERNMKISCPVCERPEPYCKCYINKIKSDAINNGGSTNYYDLPPLAKDLQDLIEHKNMDFAIGNIFKACYRLGECSHSDALRDVNKIIWFAERKKQQLLKDYK